MRVLLVNPSWDGLISRRGHRYNRAWPPLDLLNCAALLEQDGHQVDLLDARAHWIAPDEIGRKARDYDRIFATSSPLDRWQCPNIDTDKFLLTTNALPKDRLIVLGVHGTVMPEPFLQLTGARAVVLGEPEFTVQEICRKENLAEVAGLVFQNGAGPMRTAQREPPNVNTLPTPAFHLMNLDLYGYELLGDRFALLEGSRSCPWSCHFCLLEMYGNDYRRKDPERVIQDVELAVEKFGVRNAYFIDLEFTVHRKLVARLCEFLIGKKYDFHWSCQTRLDTVDADMLQMMKRSGCALIHYGVETGSERILETINKRITIDKIRKGMTLTRKVGIDSACFFMVGLPGETAEDIDKTVEFAKQLNPTYASFHVATPYPGTHFYKQYVDKGSFPISESFSQTLSLEELRRRANRAMMEFYLRPGYIGSRLLHSHVSAWRKQARLFWNFIR
jgi:anaerobic magnesium-protoporphyrin IX monomethyl ester cyclase